MRGKKTKGKKREEEKGWEMTGKPPSFQNSWIRPYRTTISPLVAPVEYQIYVTLRHQCKASICDKSSSESTDQNNVRFHHKTPYRERSE